MLPVYYEEKQRKLAERAHGTRQLTVIKYIDGDMWVSELRKRVSQAEKRVWLTVLCTNRLLTRFDYARSGEATIFRTQ